jgi:hypothetical protein
MNKRKKQRCPHPQCDGGFVYEVVTLELNREQRHEGVTVGGAVTHRYLCPICHGLTVVRRKR